MALQAKEIASWIAELPGISFTDLSDDRILGELEETFRRYPVLVFRDQDLSPAQQADMSRRIGPLEKQLNDRYLHPECSDVLILSNEIRPDGSAVGVVDAGDEWHSDSSHVRCPSKATILYSVRNPAVGGDTMYCDMTGVYDDLPAKLQDRISGQYGIHDVSKLKNPRVAVSANRPAARDDYLRFSERHHSVLQPMVRTHPETGRRSLYVSPRFTIGIDGIGDTEAQALLDELFGRMSDERYHYRHKWSDRDLVMWDNRCLNHKAMGGMAPDDIRRMHRTVLAGDEAYFDPMGRPRPSLPGA